jgi:hypothetical protein
MKPIDLFDYDNLERSYKELVKIYHPDHGGREEDFVYLCFCYEQAKFEIETGQAIGKDGVYLFGYELELHKNRKIEYSSSTEFPYGKVYVGKQCLVYEFPSDKVKEEFDYIATPQSFADDKMKTMISRQIPSINDIEKISIKKDGILIKQFVIIDKLPQTYLLSDVIKHNIPLETSIWIFNRLYGLGCYMQLHGIYNLDISPYNITVDLEDHKVQLLGGWWWHHSPNRGWWWHCPTNNGEKLKRLPMSTYNLLTNKMKETKTATIEIVTEQIKAVMRQILEGRDIPKVYAAWLSLPAQENIIEEYSQWEKDVMPKIFPVRKFYKWTI